MVFILFKKKNTLSNLRSISRNTYPGYPHFSLLLNFHNDRNITFKNNFGRVEIEKQKIKCREWLKVNVIFMWDFV